MSAERFSATTRLFLFIIVGFVISAGWAQPRLIHFPVHSANEGEEIVLEAKIEGTADRIISMRIYYKLPEEDSYRYADMRPDINKWLGRIPGPEVKGERLQYFISALMATQQIITYPEFNPYNEPEEITIFPKKEQAPETSPATQLETFTPMSEEQQKAKTGPVTTPEESQAGAGPLLLLAPEPQERLPWDEVIFAVSLSANGQFADSSTVQIFVDGRNATSRASITSFLATYEPKRLRPGPHWFKLIAKDRNGKPLPPIVVHFTVTGKTSEKKVYSRFQAHLFSDLRQQTVYGEDDSFVMSGGDFSGQYGALRYGGRVFLTSLEDKHYQPRNRFSFHLETKWAGLRGGDTYPRFNDLILWGKRVRGISGYIHLGFLNVDAVYGQTYRGVEGSTTMLKSVLTGQDSIEVVSRYGTFSQNILGIRPSIGSGRHFQFGISLVKVKDDTGSIKYGISPKDNLVIGPDLKLSFDRGRITFTAYGAFSLLTNDISSGPIATKDIEEITGVKLDVPIDPADFEKYLILNDSTIPLDPTKMTSAAYNFKLKLRYFRNIFQMGYKNVGAEYHSLANSWIRSDIKGFYFSDRFRLFNNKLYLNFGYEDYLDNFSQYTESNPSTNLRTLNYGISVYPGQNLPRLNVTMRNHYRDNGISDIQADSLLYSGVVDTVDRRENLLNKDLSVQFSYDFEVMHTKQSLFLSYISSNRDDRYSTTRLAGTFSQEFSSDIRMFTWVTNYQIPLKTTITYASNVNLAAGGSSDYKYNLFGLGAEYTLFHGKLATFAEFRSTRASGTTGTTSAPQAIDFSRSHFRFGGIYFIGQRHSITFDGNIFVLNNNAAVAGQKESYTDQVFRIRYEKFF